MERNAARMVKPFLSTAGVGLLLGAAILSAREPIGKPAIPTSASVQSPRAFLGPIPVQYAAAGTELVIDLHRFYQPGKDGAAVEVESSDRCAASFDPVAFKLHLKSPAGAQGLIEVPFHVRGDAGKKFSGVVTLALRARPEHSFIYRPPAGGAGPQKIVVAGAFNGWNKESNPLSRQPDGTWTASVALEPGNYLYKYHIDGQWVPDPANPNRAPDGFGGFNSVLEVASKSSADTPPPVRRPDSGRRPAFEWRDAVMYFALTDRFANGDPRNDGPTTDPNVARPANYHGGDWKGITGQIENGYFERLGVNVLWLAPLNLNPSHPEQEYPEPRRWYTGYHGYWPVSATEVDPRYGTVAELKALIAAAHRRGIRVLADLVLHHVHQEHPYWKEHRDWFGTLELPDGRKNLRLWDEHQFSTWFEPYLPSFDFANAAAVRALIDNTIWWAREYDLDGFRLDAVKHIPPSFWWQLRRDLRGAIEIPRGRPLYLVGETFQDRAGIMQFVGPNMLDGQFDFPLYDSIIDAFARESSGLDALEKSLLASEQAYGAGNLMSPLIGNHDKGRFMAYADGDLPDPDIPKEEEVGWAKPPRVDHRESFAKLAIAQAFLLSIDGVPMLYYGDEYGETGAGDPDNRRDMRFGDQLDPREQGALKWMQFLGQFRKKHAALRMGSRRVVASEKDLLAWVRAYRDDQVLCVFHRGAAERAAEFTVGPEFRDGSYVALPSGETVEVNGGKVSLRLPPRQALFLVRR